MSEVIVVNGKQYYAETGLLVENQPITTEVEAPSVHIHQGVQKSQTLNRRFVKQPARQTENQVEAIRQFKRKHNYEEARKRAAQMNAEAARKRATTTAQVSHFNKGVGSSKRVITPIAQRVETPITPAQIHPLQQKSILSLKFTPKSTCPQLKRLRSRQSHRLLPALTLVQKTAKRRADSKSLPFGNQRILSD